jgi:hypothetical protein
VPLRARYTFKMWHTCCSWKKTTVHSELSDGCFPTCTSNFIDELVFKLKISKAVRDVTESWGRTEDGDDEAEIRETETSSIMSWHSSGMHFGGIFHIYQTNCLSSMCSESIKRKVYIPKTKTCKLPILNHFKAPPTP